MTQHYAPHVLICVKKNKQKEEAEFWSNSYSGIFFLHLMHRGCSDIYQILRYGSKKNETVMTGCDERDGGWYAAWGRWSDSNSGPLSVGLVLYRGAPGRMWKTQRRQLLDKVLGSNNVSVTQTEVFVEGDQWDLQLSACSQLIPYHTRLVVLYTRRDWLLKCCAHLLYKDIVFSIESFLFDINPPCFCHQSVELPVCGPSDAAANSVWRCSAVLLCAVCRQEGQQHGEGGDQGVPGEQEDLSGSGGTSYRWVAVLKPRCWSVVIPVKMCVLSVRITSCIHIFTSMFSVCFSHTVHSCSTSIHPLSECSAYRLSL